jgi:multiple sugar transport system permease protein
MAAIKKTVLVGLLGIVAVVPLFPLYWLVISGLKTPQEFSKIPPTWFPTDLTFKPFQRALEAISFGQSFTNSLIIAGVSTLSVLITSLLAGYAFSKHHFRGRDQLFWAVVGTMFLPPIVTLVPLFWIVTSMGLSDTYLGVVLPWLANAFGIFLMRQFMNDVPDELIDAARVDGASEIRILFRIVAPLLAPAVVTLGVFAFVYYWNNFLWPLSILQSEEKYPIVLSLSRLLSYNMSVEYRNVVLAGAVIASIPTILVFLLSQRVFVQGIARTGVKG